MRLKIAALLAALSALVGCAGVKYPDYYTLAVPAPVHISGEVAPIHGTVLVREFREPEYLRQGPIVYRPVPEQIAFYDYHHWAEDPGRVVTAAVISELQKVFESASLYDGRGAADFLLTGSLDHLEEVDGQGSISVDVGISAKLVSPDTGDVVWAGTSGRTSKVEQRSITGVVSEMARDLGGSAADLASSLAGQVSRRTAAKGQ